MDDLRPPRLRGRRNAEAARRAGINVPRIKILVFMISGATAGIGGIIFSAQVNSVA